MSPLVLYNEIRDPSVKRIPDSLDRVLGESGIAVATFEWLPGDEVPQPYRDLLVHKNDMTSTLESFHGSKIGLNTLRASSDDTAYTREVVLFSKTSGKPVEYGAIDIQIGVYEEEERALILEGVEPLGSILNRMRPGYTSDPFGYFSLKASDVCSAHFNCPAAASLFGRFNELVSDVGERLATIIEILPPEESDGSA